jgi:hypothetical protein
VPDFGTGWIPTYFAGIQRSDTKIDAFVVDFHKRAYKNEDFKFRKRFTVFKTVNCFQKLKKNFYDQTENDFR